MAGETLANVLVKYDSNMSEKLFLACVYFSKLDPICNCHQIDVKNTQNYGAFSNKRLFKEN
jgi:hypothetical protein